MEPLFSSHFAICFTDMKERSHTYIDRFYDVQLKRTAQNKERPEHLYTHSFLHGLDKVFTENNDGVTPVFNFSKFDINIYGRNNIPVNERQTDGHSCGIIMLTQIFMLLSKKKITSFKNKYHKEAREQIGVMMYNAFKNKYNV
jgi:hypothetical protein